MNLMFNTALAARYRAKPQIIRVLSEAWVRENGYCPYCGHDSLNDFANNQPVADFYCPQCAAQYELKSKQARLGHVINDGAYETMIARINSADNPSFFFLTYAKDYLVNNFLLIPKHFFTPEIIIKRKPLSATAKRAGWVGCNIDLRHVPESGKVFLVKDKQVIARQSVTAQLAQTTFLQSQSLSARGWTLDVWRCIDQLPARFSLTHLYAFSDTLRQKHPNNQHIHAKIRQQLQILRDKGFIEFVGRGQYRKIQ
ncbi:DpnI domain-containing protein [Psychrobacter aestuarii]|nr:DpnI domain-containing protein [Psychrobacter aestuarii]